MKKILLLGGSAQQIVAIETAKKLGYYTILCDYLPDNPGQNYADKFYLASTTDKELILEISKKENIDGILAYASDPAAPTAAYVAEKIGLNGNSYTSVDILCNKDKFRRFLKENNFNTPKAKGYNNIDEALEDIKNCEFELPVIVKPVDSSGSKGATVLNTKNNISEALSNAFLYSKSKKIIVEEFISKKHKYLVGGDIFVSDGKIIIWGLLNCHRDNCVNSLVPVGKSFPLALEKKDIKIIKEELQRLVDKINIKNGAMNVEVIIDKKGRVFFIDIGPRNGGNMIPDLLGYIFNIDIVEMTIKCVMGEKIENKCEISDMLYATYNLHSDKNGILNGISFSKNLDKFIIKKCIYKNLGDKVEFFDNASKALGIIFLKFDNITEMSEIINDINNNIYIDVI